MGLSLGAPPWGLSSVMVSNHQILYLVDQDSGRGFPQTAQELHDNQ